MPDSGNYHPQEKDSLYGSDPRVAFRQAAGLVRRSLKKPLTYVLLLVIIGCGVGAYWFSRTGAIMPPAPSLPKIPKVELPSFGRQGSWDFTRFQNETEFKDYLNESADLTAGLFGSVSLLGTAPGGITEPMRALDMGAATEAGGFFGTAAPTRVSQTNVQVVGIDEPDIVKTNGQEIFFSPPLFWRYPQPVSILEERSIAPPPVSPVTEVITAFPPAALSVLDRIDRTGELLLLEEMLVIFTDEDRIFGYDVSDPANPVEKWQMSLDEKQTIVDVRLTRGKIYLVTRSSLNYDRPCPLPLTTGGQRALTIACDQIYHPVDILPVDVTFSALVLSPETGKIEESVSFIGSARNSVVYMSAANLFVSFTYNRDLIAFLNDFYSTQGQDLLPASLLERLQKLEDYDLSQAAKLTEYTSIFEKHLNSLGKDERLKLENEFENRIESYTEEHLRDLQQTGLVRIDLDGLKVKSTGSFPGRLLNQFSMDEYQGNLRVATTVDSLGFGESTSVNDVYVFDDNLKQIGSVLDLGVTERIYSVRFLGEQGYVVTFRQVDPFYVLDLSDPKNPQMSGELKIPGYSSYLHPLADDRILGVGKEGSRVKVSLFNVASPSNPLETSKYTLDESWSEALENHHAFLQDSRHEVFFLPGNRGGYVFSYANDALKMVKAVDGLQIRRALYLDDYLYLIGDQEIIVLNETDWQEVNRLEL